MTNACMVSNFVVRKTLARESSISVVDWKFGTNVSFVKPYCCIMTVAGMATVAANMAANMTACKEYGGSVP